MKPHATIGIIFASFALGLLAGREFFPTVGSEGAAARDGGAKPNKALFADRQRAGRHAGGDDTNPGADAASVSALLERVNVADPFATSKRLHELLGGLGADELEGLLAGLGDVPASDPRLSQARSTVFNFLADADPARAFALAVGHADEEFRNAFLPIAIAALAESDLLAAREALGLIDDPALRNAAQRSIVSASLGGDPAAIAELLGELEDSSPIFYSYPSLAFNQSPFAGPFYYDGWSSGGVTLLRSDTSDLIGQWAARDPAAAEAYARGLKDPDKRDAALGAIAGSMAKQDPEAALDWARSLGGAAGNTTSIMTVLGVFAEMDPARAATLLDDVVSPQQRSSLISTIASNWVSKDPAAAMAWLGSLPSSQARSQAYNTLFYQVTQTDPQAATQLLDRLPLHSRNQAIPNIASSWIHKDFDAAREWVLGLEDRTEREGALNSIFGTWSKEHPMNAMEFLASEGAAGLQNRNGMFSTLAGEWAQQDQSVALGWAGGIRDQHARSSAFTGIYNQWATQSPEAAAAHLAAVGDPVERNALLDSLAQQWSARDPQAALAWYEQLGPEERTLVGSSIVSNLANGSPELAAAAYARLVAETGGDETQSRALAQNASSIASRWSQHDPQAAATWASGLQNEDARRSAVGQVVSNWLQFDPSGASAWLVEMPAGNIRDSAAQQLVGQISHIDPAAAFEWAESIGDPEQRFDSVRDVLNQWRYRDNESALQAFEALDRLTPEQREELGRRFQ